MSTNEDLRQALEGGPLEQLWDSLIDAVGEHGTDDYWPVEAVASDVERIEFMEIRRAVEIRLEEIDHSDEDQHTCRLAAGVEMDLQWSSSAPTGFDLERFAGLQENADSDAPILQGYESPAKFEVDFFAAWDLATDAWRNLEITRVRLAEPEFAERKGRMSQEEKELIEQKYGDGESAGP